MLMSVPLIHVIPMLTVTTLLEVSLACADQVSVEMEWLAQVRSFNLQNIDFVSILLWFITCYLILDSKILMSVPLIHVIPMLTVPTLLEVSLARVSQVSVEMEWLAQVIFNSQNIDSDSILLWYLTYYLILDSKMLMSVPLIHVIPMLTATTLLEVSLARVSQVSVEMEWLAQVI